jgi:hypothetical protein
LTIMLGAYVPDDSSTIDGGSMHGMQDTHDCYIVHVLRVHASTGGVKTRVRAGPGAPQQRFTSTRRLLVGCYLKEESSFKASLYI